MKNIERKSVLVVDDEPASIMGLTKILDQDYTVYVAKNGANAVKLAKEKLPDMILLDIIMPDMNGYEVISMLKNTIETKDIPVVFISGLGTDEYEEKGLELGAVDYIHKPFAPEIVKLRVRNQIKH